jgi:sn-glycerol 3-phosphate transport system substrate-binding protein
MRTRTTLAVLAASSLGLLAACSSGDDSILDAGQEDTTAPAGTEAAGATTEAPTTTATPLADLPPCPIDALETATGPIDLTFWHAMNGDNEDALQALVDEYNATQTKVRVTLQNQGGYEQNIEKYLQSGQSSRPDIVQLPEYAVQTMIDTESTVPMGACVEAAAWDTSDLLPQALNQYTSEGVQWSMPFNVSDPILYYNKRMFTEAGLDPATSPITLEQLREYSQAIVDAGAATYGISLDTGQDSGGGWFIEQWFARAGEFYADNDNGRTAPATKVLYDNATGVELMTFMQQMVADGLAVDVGDNASGQDALLKLADPQTPAAMTIATSAALGTVLNLVRGGTIPGITEADIGVGPMPGPSPTPGAIVGGASLWIVNDHGDDKTAAAWDFVQFMVSPQSQSTWAAATGYIPVSEEATTLDPIGTRYTEDPRFKVAFDQLLSTEDSPTSVGPLIGPQLQVRNVTARATAAIFQGADVAATLTDAVNQANALIADYNARN